MAYEAGEDLVPDGKTHRSLAKVERTSLKCREKQFGPPLSPPSSQRPELPPLMSEAGTKPLASEPTIPAVADLGRGLPMEVKLLPEPFSSILMGLMALTI
jgi:hypothetical protein